MRLLKAGIASDKRRQDNMTSFKGNGCKFPMETICKATAVSITLLLLRRGGRFTEVLVVFQFIYFIVPCQ
jgi:hypothetical protein